MVIESTDTGGLKGARSLRDGAAVKHRRPKAEERSRRTDRSGAGLSTLLGSDCSSPVNSLLDSVVELRRNMQRTSKHRNDTAPYRSQDESDAHGQTQVLGTQSATTFP